jgi:hypothetical protein
MYKILYFLQFWSKMPRVVIYSLKIRIGPKLCVHTKIMSCPYGTEVNEKEFRYYLMNFITSTDLSSKLDFHNVPCIPREDDCFLSFPVEHRNPFAPTDIDSATGMKKGKRRQSAFKKKMHKVPKGTRQ